MTGVASPPTTTGGQLVNPPSLATLASALGRGLILAPVVAVFATLLFTGFHFNLSSYLLILAVSSVGLIVVASISSLSEPVLLVTPTTISMSRWAPRILGRGSWQTYPMQPLTLELRRSRGGTYIRTYLTDATGWRRRVMFTIVSIGDLRSQLLQAGCTVY